MNLFQNLCMSQSAVKFSGRQNVARKKNIFSNIYNLGTVSPTEVRRISKWPHEQGLFIFLLVMRFMRIDAHLMRIDAHQQKSAHGQP